MEKITIRRIQPAEIRTLQNQKLLLKTSIIQVTDFLLE